MPLYSAFIIYLYLCKQIRDTVCSKFLEYGRNQRWMAYQCVCLWYEDILLLMSQQQRILSWEEIGKHIIPSDCWVVVEGRVFNVTDFLVEHPGGDQILLKYSGLDATKRFLAVPHSQYAVSLRNARQVGKVATQQYPEGYEEKLRQAKSAQLKKSKKIIKIDEPIDPEIIKRHRSEEDCWIIINGKVYDATTYLEEHPGGVMKIMEYAGKDATQGFESAGHSVTAMEKKQQLLIGKVKKSSGSMGIILLTIAILGVFCALYTVYTIN